MHPRMSSPAQALTGRVAIVTGVSRRIGIGFAIATRLAQLGADLLVHGYAPHDAQQPWGADPGGLPALAAELAEHGGAVELVEADLAVAEAPARVVQAAVERLGHVDVLVANHA